MNILAIDYGTKRSGLALADKDLAVVLPYGTLDKGDLALALAAVIDKAKIGQVVVGLPLGLDGRENENTKNVRAFVADLKSQIKLPVEFVDERFTTAQADKMGGEVSADEKAAMLILQTYLDQSLKA